ncbi:MAG: ankyrin repeat domain-containing protein, partial [Acidobacteria bacterium]|nr:ankyrin repeat domain-containing protein [Acidobacteriota bacterium]
RGGKTEAVAVLLEASANVNAKRADGWDALMLAVNNGRADAAMKLLDAGSDIKTMDAKSYTLLHLSAKTGTAPLVSALIAKGAAVDAELDKRAGSVGFMGSLAGMTPLMIACQAGNLPAVETLLKAGANVKHRTGSGISPLYLAAGSRKLPVVKAIVEAGGNLNDQGPQQRTAIHLASFIPSEDIIQYLLEKGSDLTLKDRQGVTVRDAAAKSGNTKTLALLARLDEEQKAKSAATKP